MDWRIERENILEEMEAVEGLAAACFQAAAFSTVLW
jgi:hypothetical protein